MGNDGGSIPDRTSQIRVRKRKKRINRLEIQKSKSNLCSMTKEKLRKPIVADRLGQLYNKTSVIEFLLNKNKRQGFEHINSLKNVKELKCLINDNGFIQCPISQEEFSGLNKFFFLWTCGCVYSKTAIDELNIINKCINCNIEFNRDKDLISLNYDKKMKRKILKNLLNIKKYSNNNINNKDNIDNNINDFNKDIKDIKILNRKIKRNKDI